MSGGEINLLQILWQSGFVVKLVLIILIFCSLYSWAIIVNKFKAFKRIETENEEFNELFENLDNQNLAKLSIDSSDLSESSTAVVFNSGFSELKKMQSMFASGDQKDQFKDFFSAHGLETLQRSLENGANIANKKLENRLTILASIGSISPFIGLFGTVWGIIDSFTGLAAGGGSIEAVAPGIAEALVATAVGLAAAIPAVLAYNLFSNRIENINGEMEEFAKSFINFVERQIWSVK